MQAQSQDSKKRKPTGEGEKVDSRKKKKKFEKGRVEGGEELKVEKN